MPPRHQPGDGLAAVPSRRCSPDGRGPARPWDSPADV